MLKENTDYNIEVKPSETQVGGCTAAVMCQICNERKHLGIDNKGCIKLSNWYCHVEKCINQNRKKGTPTTQIDHFFSSCKTKTSATQLEHSFCASTVTHDDISVMTPTLEDETTTSASGMADEVPAVKTDEASASLFSSSDF